MAGLRGIKAITAIEPYETFELALDGEGWFMSPAPRPLRGWGSPSVWVAIRTKGQKPFDYLEHDWNEDQPERRFSVSKLLVGQAVEFAYDLKDGKRTTGYGRVYAVVRAISEDTVTLDRYLSLEDALVHTIKVESIVRAIAPARRELIAQLEAVEVEHKKLVAQNKLLVARSRDLKLKHSELRALIDTHDMIDLDFPALKAEAQEEREAEEAPPFMSAAKPESTPDAATTAAPAPKKEPVRAIRAIGRNEPCPCGSGTKYKKCCLLKKQ